MLSVEAINKERYILKRAMKNKIRSLLGIEMSIGNLEIKPIILLLGVLLFIGLAVPLALVYCYLYIKNTLVENIKELKKHKSNNKDNGIKWV